MHAGYCILVVARLCKYIDFYLKAFFEDKW